MRILAAFLHTCVGDELMTMMASQDSPPYQLREYGYKRISDDVAELARQLGADRIILGGHDW
jgi:pimeloyl-ACP methyl ester carboxylesterase